VQRNRIKWDLCENNDAPGKLLRVRALATRYQTVGMSLVHQTFAKLDNRDALEACLSNEDHKNSKENENFSERFRHIWSIDQGCSEITVRFRVQFLETPQQSRKNGNTFS
jgi:hypothetical protein